MRRPIVIGNWKLHGSRDLTSDLMGPVVECADACEGVDCVVCPPFVYLEQALDQAAGSRLAVGAQDVSDEAEGAYTGEVAAGMLADIHCGYVIVGHSERRERHHESDQLVARKFAAAVAAGLSPVICVGESLAERDVGEAEEVVRRQVESVLEAVGATGFGPGIIAYEPVWAIGTGRSAGAADVQQVHALIRSILAERDKALAERTRIIYGGSIKATNAAVLFSEADVDGALVGGASLDADDFTRITRAAARSLT